MSWAISGVIEGFYGHPWTWADRAEVMRVCAGWDMSHYVYAPKDDPLHRERWRDPYPDEDLRRFESLVGEGTLAVGFAVSPGLSIDYDSDEDRDALAAKIDDLVAVGIELIVLALDDIPPAPGLGARHASLTTWLQAHLGDRTQLVLVPTEYTGTTTTPYLEELAQGVPDDVAIAWTGNTVVCDRIDANDARARAASLGGRPPLVWDNYPVNDGFMADRLFLGPLRGRDPGLAEVSYGYLANPMLQPRSSLLPLASIAGYLRGEDPDEVWSHEADRLGIRVLAEACDGDRPSRLVEAVLRAGPDEGGTPIEELDDWLRRAAHAETGALSEEAAPWAAQTRREANLGRAALRLLAAVSAGQAAHASEQALAIGFAWPEVRRSAVTVLGPRCSFRPVISQFPDGEWRWHPESLQEGANAIDRLVHHALAQLGTPADR